MSKRALLIRNLLLWGVLSLLLLVPPVQAHPTPALHLDGPTDPEEMAAFFDVAIPAQLDKYDIPGAAIAVVKDGELFFSKGYGVTNSKTAVPVVADQTLFHIGSVTKLFTWTAIMQLVEQGKLDLHTDINTYLTALQFPDTYPEPITLEHLLTHTPGFEDRLSNLLRLNRYDGLPLEAYIIRQQPQRIMPPGQLIAYSNYGGALAGYIIQEVTGIPYEDYIETHIFAPLTMQHSSIRRPVAVDLMPDVSSGHIGGPGGVIPLVEYFPSAPMVGVSATVTDMAKFMIAHLQQGRYGDQRIMEAATAQNMQRQHFTHDPRLPGVTYGFVEWHRNQHRILWHSGSTPLFQCVLVLIPEENLGMFVAYNRKSGQVEVGKLLRDAFLDHYYPITVPPPEPLEGAARRVRRFAGDYRENRWSDTTADKFLYMLTRYYEMRAKPNGTLEVMDSTYVEVEPLFFQEMDGQGLLLFKEDARGCIKYGFYDYDPHKVFIKLTWYETLDFQLVVVVTCLIIFLSTLFKLHLRDPAARRAGGHREILYFTQWIGIVNLIYPPAMLLIGLSTVMQPLPDLSLFAPLFIIALVGVLLAAVVTTILAWKDHYWTFGTRLYYTLVTLMALVFAVWLRQWNLLGMWHY